uniref:NARG2_C domain-containing protein n=1 Tax=Rhabditophanes sp. KR3021 TaxID=114890 RepID=A0AC35TNI3_9BILA
MKYPTSHFHPRGAADFACSISSQNNIVEKDRPSTYSKNNIVEKDKWSTSTSSVTPIFGDYLQKYIPMIDKHQIALNEARENYKQKKIVDQKHQGSKFLRKHDIESYFKNQERLLTYPFPASCTENKTKSSTYFVNEMMIEMNRPFSNVREPVLNPKPLLDNMPILEREVPVGNLRSLGDPEKMVVCDKCILYNLDLSFPSEFNDPRFQDVTLQIAMFLEHTFNNTINTCDQDSVGITPFNEWYKKDDGNKSILIQKMKQKTIEVGSTNFKCLFNVLEEEYYKEKRQQLKLISLADYRKKRRPDVYNAVSFELEKLYYKQVAKDVKMPNCSKCCLIMHAEKKNSANKYIGKPYLVIKQEREESIEKLMKQLLDEEAGIIEIEPQIATIEIEKESFLTAILTISGTNKVIAKSTEDNFIAKSTEGKVVATSSTNENALKSTEDKVVAKPTINKCDAFDFSDFVIVD